MTDASRRSEAVPSGTGLISRRTVLRGATALAALSPLMGSAAPTAAQGWPMPEQVVEGRATEYDAYVAAATKPGSSRTTPASSTRRG
jgi:hypothetical protein